MKKLLSNPQSFDQVLNCLAHGVTIQDPYGKLIYANKVAAKMMNCKSPSEAVARGGASIINDFHLFDEHGKELNLADLPGRQALQGAEEPEMIVGFKLHGSDKVRWTVIKASPVFDENGTLTHAVNVLQDVTALKETEIRLRDANERITDLLEQALSPSR